MLIIIAGIRILGLGPDPRAIDPEQEWDPAARQRHEEQDHTGPLVPTRGIHLLGEEHHPSAPETADERLGGEGTGSLVLVRVDEVVVGRVVQEDEAEPDPEAAEARAEPVQAGVGCPGEDDEAQRDEPAGAHHRNEAVFGGRVAVEAGSDFEVVLVDPGGQEGRGNDAKSERNLV